MSLCKQRRRWMEEMRIDRNYIYLKLRLVRLKIAGSYRCYITKEINSFALGMKTFNALEASSFIDLNKLCYFLKYKSIF